MANLIPIQLDKSTGRFYAKNAGSGGTFSVAGFVFNQSSAIQTWVINHNASTEQVLVQVFGLDNHVVLPDTITIINGNTLTIGFATPQAGKATIALFLATI